MGASARALRSFRQIETGRSETNWGWVFVALLLLTPSLAWIGIREYNSIIFDRDCVGYLKNAADAFRVEKAVERLDHALKYLKDYDITTGYTTALFTGPMIDLRTQNENVEFWYNNILESRNLLAEIDEDADDNTRSNALKKLREALLDETEKGTVVTLPPGIHLYPYNNSVAYLGLFSLAFAILAGICLMYAGQHKAGLRLEAMIVLSIIILIIMTL